MWGRHSGDVTVCKCTCENIPIDGRDCLFFGGEGGGISQMILLMCSLCLLRKFGSATDHLIGSHSPKEIKKISESTSFNSMLYVVKLSLRDLREGLQGRTPPPPPSDPNSFIFMQFSATNSQNNRLAHSLWELAHSPSGIPWIRQCERLLFVCNWSVIHMDKNWTSVSNLLVQTDCGYMVRFRRNRSQLCHTGFILHLHRCNMSWCASCSS